MSYAYSFDESSETGWTTVEAATPQEAAAQAFAESDADVVYVGAAVRPRPEDYIDLDRILDDIGEQEEFAGEWTDGWRDYSEEHQAGLTAALQKAFGDYLDAHNLRPAFYNVENIEAIHRP